MSDEATAGSSGKGLSILIIHAAGRKPNKASVSKLLSDAGVKAASLTFATPAEIANGSINPSDFDHVIVLLDDDLSGDDHLEEGMKGLVNCGFGAIGIWAEEMDSEDMHPAVQKYGAKQIPWDAKELSQALNSEAPETFQSTRGGSSASHETTHNKC
ncbi:hypothetical protein ACP90_26390 [Labrenzia sp. CP4]|jgi:hypothetical protein|uniref:hypothetical protein n=1 Tax=Labrenzia sp. CP4 TaxID=1674922 RepID=UPI0007813994|nr:hypothetical protein [Labrenzia sp. CP4]AMN55328.1 hypothetical protein ACP90_26390 [Labrenzia sp. CP4]